MRWTSRTPAARSRRLIRRLMPGDGDVQALCDVIGQHRHRPIRLVPLAMPPTGATSGAWIPCADHDLILFAANSSPARRDGAICHELAHMLLEHDPASEGTAPAEFLLMARRALAPDLGEPADRLLLLRDVYATDVEQEAENLGREISSLAMIRQTEAHLTQDRVSRLLR